MDRLVRWSTLIFWYLLSNHQSDRSLPGFTVQKMSSSKSNPKWYKFTWTNCEISDCAFLVSLKSRLVGKSVDESSLSFLRMSSPRRLRSMPSLLTRTLTFLVSGLYVRVRKGLGNLGNHCTTKDLDFIGLSRSLWSKVSFSFVHGLIRGGDFTAGNGTGLQGLIAVITE